MRALPFLSHAAARAAVRTWCDGNVACSHLVKTAGKPSWVGELAPMPHELLPPRNATITGRWLAGSRSSLSASRCTRSSRRNTTPRSSTVRPKLG